MTGQFRWLVLFVAIIIVIIIVVKWHDKNNKTILNRSLLRPTINNTPNRSKKHNKKRTGTSMQDGSMSIKQNNDIVSKGTKINLSSFIGKAKISSGDLFQSCPCKSGFICEDGICKRAPMGDCVTGSSCIGSQVCFLGACTEQPTTWQERASTAFDENQLCIEGHALRLIGNKFTMPPGWWSLRKVSSIIEDVDTGFFLAASDEGFIFRCLADPVLRNMTLIEQTISIKKLIKLADDIFILTTTGILFKVRRNRGYTLPEGSQKDSIDDDEENTTIGETTIGETWSYERVHSIGDNEITKPIEDIQVCCNKSNKSNNSEISIVYNKSIDLFFPPGYNKFSSHNDINWCHQRTKSFNKMSIGFSINNRVLLYDNHFAFYPEIFDENKIIPDENVDLELGFKIEIKGQFKEALIDPVNELSILVLTNNGDVFRYSFPNLTKNHLRRISRISHRHERLIDSIGKKLISSGGNIWLITDKSCMSV